MTDDADADDQNCHSAERPIALVEGWRAPAVHAVAEKPGYEGPASPLQHDSFLLIPSRMALSRSDRGEDPASLVARQANLALAPGDSPSSSD